MDGKSTSQPKYTIQREEFNRGLYDELTPLLNLHWEEIAANQGEMPLNPQFEAYEGLQLAGLFVAMICRREDTEEIMGYAMFFCTPHLHYKDTLCAENDIIYLRPEYRKGFTGIRLIKESERVLKEIGCGVITMRVKLAMDFGKVLERLGFTPSEVAYRKYVGED